MKPIFQRKDAKSQSRKGILFLAALHLRAFAFKKGGAQ
jgi:hypothetical protein